MRRVLTRVRNFVLSSVGSGTVVLFGVLVIGAVILWRREISYAHPGPTIAIALLAVVVLVIGLVINTLQAQEAHETPSRGPRLTGLELLIERWKNFGPEQHHSEILHQQFSIALSLTQLAYREYDEIRFVKYFSGFKIRGGAFLFQPGQDIARVLKFDSLANIETEVDRYEHCVKDHLGFTPGEPSVPEQRYGTIDGQEWGVIIYKLIGTDQVETGRLQTFAEYYQTHDASQQITEALDKIFVALRPWWMNPVGSDDGTQGRQDTLYDEYNRLTRKHYHIVKEISEAGKEIQISTLQNINASSRTIDLGSDLELRNPLNWIKDVFGDWEVSDWINHVGLRRDSIVHGDLHAGNILISEDIQEQTGEDNQNQPSEDRQVKLRAWVIDFPHVHVGPTVQDIARLEADLKFGLLAHDTFGPLSVDEMIDEMNQLESSLLPEPGKLEPSLADLTPAPLLPHQRANTQLQKAWTAVCQMREEASKYMIGNDARPYYLALLHATLPALYYRNRSPWQKLHTFISAALLCERLGG